MKDTSLLTGDGALKIWNRAIDNGADLKTLQQLKQHLFDRVTREENGALGIITNELHQLETGKP